MRVCFPCRHNLFVRSISEERETTLLTVTNILIGVCVLICCLLVMGKLSSEIVQRKREQKEERKTREDLSVFLLKLGITLGDGGVILREEKE